MLEGQIKSGVTKEKKTMLPTRKIALSFLAVIFIGSLLLCLPFANKRDVLPYIDNLFISVSAVCVTGLVTTVPVEQYSIFGQIVIIVLIQIGGLGFLTFLYLLLIKIRKKLSLHNKLVLQEALNQNSLSKIPNFVKNIIRFTFIVEAIGALCLSTVFIPKYGILKGIYYSIFHAVSAFCNAGFDLIGDSSLMPFQGNIIVNLVVAGLIIAGGLGFVVWFDIYHKTKKEYHRPTHFDKRHLFQTLTLHTKIVLIMTTFLLLSGTVLFFALEYNNTLKGMSLDRQILVSFFQSTTLRTAGFATVNCVDMLPATKLVTSLFMLIGGSPAGTAGGIKTVTFAVVLLMIFNIYRGNRELFVFRKRIKKRLIIRSFALLAIAMTISLFGLMVLSITEKMPFIDLIFETFSAFGTVGLSASVTPHLTDVGKCVIMLLMYIGRIGPITMIISFARKQALKVNNKISYPDEDILIG